MPVRELHDTDTSTDRAHPTDNYSVLRFAVRIPIVKIEAQPGSLAPWRPTSPTSEDDEAQDTQCFELCFHAGFAPDPDPVSLHMLPSGCIEHHDPAPVLRTPRPPCYIHELPDLIDLTDAADDANLVSPKASKANSSSGSSGSSAARLAVWLLLATLYTIVVLGGGLVLGRQLRPSDTRAVRPPPRAQKHEPAEPFPSTPLPPPSNATYVLDVAVPTTQALSLYKDLLPVERLHLAAEADVAEVVATDPDLGLDCELNNLVGRVCRDVSFHIDNETVPSLTPATLRADIKLTCQHIFHRLLKLHRPLRALKAASPHQGFMDTKLSFTAWMLDTAVEAGYDAPGSLPRAYAKGLLDPDRQVWRQCRFCSSPPPVDVDITAAVAVADWHFACDPSFFNLSASLASRPAVAVNNYFKSWGKQQSARRFAALRSSPLDVDDTPLYPNNQHPFDEADDIHNGLPGESDLNNMVRNVVETATAIDELLDLLGALNVSAVSGPPANGTMPSPPEVSPTSSQPWWQMLRPRSRSAPVAGNRRVAIRQGTARLAELRNDLLTPLVRSLGRASASMVVACAEADKQRARMRGLAAGRGWDREAAYISDGEDEENKNGVSSSTGTVVVHVAYTAFTADMAAEASALRAESAERLAESQSAVAAAKATATMRLLASRELAAARSQSSTTLTLADDQLRQADAEDDDEPPLPPMGEGDLAFEQRVREKLEDDPMRRMADMLQGG